MEDAEVKQKKRVPIDIRKQEELWHEDTREQAPRGQRLIFRIS